MALIHFSPFSRDGADLLVEGIKNLTTLNPLRKIYERVQKICHINKGKWLCACISLTLRQERLIFNLACDEFIPKEFWQLSFWFGQLTCSLVLAWLYEELYIVACISISSYLLKPIILDANNRTFRRRIGCLIGSRIYKVSPLLSVQSFWCIN